MVVAERDAIMWEMRKNGMAYRAIAKQCNVSEATAHAGIKRVMAKMNSRLVIDYSAEARFQIETLNDLKSAIMPLTRQHKMTLEDGTEITIPPSLDAIDRVLKIEAQRAKLLGLEQNSIEVNVNSGNAPAIAGKKVLTTEKTPEMEARELVAIMMESGILDAETLAAFEVLNVVEAEVIEDVETTEYQIPDFKALNAPNPDEPPEYMEES